MYNESISFEILMYKSNEMAPENIVEKRHDKLFFETSNHSIILKNYFSVGGFCDSFGFSYLRFS